jgi:hypothetical protein
MKINDIERETFQVIEWSEPVLTLADEAASVLGYEVLKQQQSEPSSQSKLQQVLAKIGVETLKESSVKAYQEERLLEQTEVRYQAWKKNPLGTFVGPSWEKVTIERYREPIPEFVLNEAIQIKREMPEVRIYVEHLTDFPDPFLIVATRHKDYEILDGETVYVEVWEEPKFEGKLR